MTLLRGALRTIALVAVVCCLSWLGGLLWFATPPAADTRAAATDAIVVLNGGSLGLRGGTCLFSRGERPQALRLGRQPAGRSGRSAGRFRPCPGLGALLHRARPSGRQH